MALWRSLERYDRRCSLRTWVYRVAHNTAISLAVRRGTRAPALVSLGDITPIADERSPERGLDERRALARLMSLVRELAPMDRQVMMLYLEELEASAIAEITGLSPGAVATRIHRIKQLLKTRFCGEVHAD
jgi:RNA polymerase sigma-70 factor (ECF subfamily)